MKTTATVAPLAISPATSSAGLIQRQCACAGKSPGAYCGAENCTRKKFAGVQAKSRISVPGEPLEVEADRVADQVLGMFPNLPHAAGERSLLPLVQHSGRHAAGLDPNLPHEVSQVLRTPGQALDPVARAYFEPRFGHDFSRVRVHSDGISSEAARAIDADAFTAGLHVVLGAGQYDPGTVSGRRLLAHELTHVVQQSGSSVPSVGEAVIARRGTARSPPNWRALRRQPRSPQTRAAPKAKPRDSTITEPQTEPAPGPSPDPGQRYVPEPGSMDWELDENLKGLDKYRAESHLAITTIRGGKPPDFITTGAEQLLATPRGNIRFSPRSFHVLDALKFDATHAGTPEDEFNIVVDYMPDVIRSMEGFEDVLPVRSPKGKSTTLGTTQLLHSLYIEHWDPDAEDPKAKLRLKVYFDALAAKATKTSPAPTQKAKPRNDDETVPKPGTADRTLPKHVPTGGRCPTGTKADPIGMVWCKPLKFYKKLLNLDGGKYARDSQKALTLGNKQEIGVPEWPGRGSLLKREPVPRGKSADQFKEAIEAEGFEQWKEYSPDHVLDLFFKGKDRFDNLWPLEREVNRRAGTWHPGQPVCYSDPPQFKPTWKALGTSELVGRWFVVKEVREPPP